MNLYDYARYLLVVSGVLIIALISIAVYLNTKSKKSSLLYRNKSKKSMGISIYNVISRNKFTKSVVRKIRNRVQMVHDYSEPEIRKATTNVFFIIIMSLLVLVITFVNLTQNIYLIGIFMVASYFFADTILDYFVEKLKNKLMYQQIEFNELVRHKFYELKMVDEAIYEASQDVPKKNQEIGIQGMRIYDVLMSKNVEKEMYIYNETAPNKYLKMLMALAFMTKEFGDTKIENGASLFMKSLNYLNSEIRMEVIKRERLNYALKSLTIIVLLPLFFIEPIKNWASNHFAPLEKFYSSQSGFLIELGLVLLVVTCFFLIRKIQKMEDSNIRTNQKTIDEKIYNKFYKFLDRFIPRKQTKKYKRCKMALKKVLAPFSVETFYTRKLIVGSIFFVTSLLLVLYLKDMNRKNILYEPTIPSGFLGGQVSDNEKEKAIQITDQDREIIVLLDYQGTKEEIAQTIEGKRGIENVESIEVATQRIYEKINQLNRIYIKWWEILLCLVVFLVGYVTPNLMIVLQNRMRKIDMDDEVSQFHTILLILMHVKKIGVFEILEWMELFSVYFKQEVGDCLNNFDAGSYEALEQLKMDVPHPTFINIVNNLQLAVEELSINEAFDELESEKVYYQDLRRLTNEKIIYRKQWTGQMIGFIPVYSLIIFYLMIPMIVNSMQEMTMYFDEIR
ncbi:hypothetical protein EDC19_2771 [Natranaerovirga hydrolytica]|uniref:Uncharacterized protein n=1 Tax=Natranaerovirga hydrolytica TaxID=680378 RepID=A0A4R1M813_9FIRM|nr:hypothetical protein [Natranaerovirga hydrolytica]TCK87927.1 hypothetical protein EDC19_2771 [Natranaerovirga hydrolytica]